MMTGNDGHCDPSIVKFQHQYEHGNGETRPAAATSSLAIASHDQYDHVEESPAGSTCSRDAIVEPRLKRDNGYGDVCFDRLCAWNILVHLQNFDESYKKIFYDDQKAHTNNIRMVELGSFRRQGTFPFMRLPFELRNRIMKLLLGTFFTSEGCFIVDIEAGYSWYRMWGGEYEEYQARNAGGPASFIRCPDAESYYRVKAMFQHYVAQHPGRSCKYEMILKNKPSLKPNGQPDTRNMRFDWSMIEQLRHISNVSNIIRLELSSLLWAYTQINVDTDSCGEVLAFLQERPAIRSQIRSIHFRIVIDYMIIDDNERKFTDLCNFATVCLQLESLSLTITSWEHPEILDGEDGEVLLRCMPLLRSFKVTRSFSFYCLMEPDADVIWLYHDKGLSELCADYMRRWQVIGENMARPDTLRSSEPKTEIEEYLRRR